MEVRPDTSSSSGRFRGQWSFLANPPQNAHPRSLPPSSYIPHSDRSSISPLPTGLNYQSADRSRSSLTRDLTVVSVGGRSTATIPSQPVLLRVHSADASRHTNPAPRPMRPLKTTKNGLPVVSEYSFQGILDAIQEDVEQDINTISEILGRSRLVLADQYDSHLPPQGEIRAPSTSLQAVEEASANDERLAMLDDVMILRDDASLVHGSQTGSAAYDLLERLQAVPRPHRVNGDLPTTPARAEAVAPVRANLLPMASPVQDPMRNRASEVQVRRSSRQLLQSDHDRPSDRRSGPAVSESFLSAGANGGVTPIDRSLYPDEQHSDGRTLRDRMSNFMNVNDPIRINAWLRGQTDERENDASGEGAEGHLRLLLQRSV